MCAFENIKASVDRFKKDHSHKLMRKRELRNGKAHVARILYLVVKSVRASYDQTKLAVSLRDGVKALGKLLRRKLLSLDTQSYLKCLLGI